MEKARYNTELYSNLRVPLNNVKPSNFWGSHHSHIDFLLSLYLYLLLNIGLLFSVSFKSALEEVYETVY